MTGWRSRRVFDDALGFACESSGISDPRRSWQHPLQTPH
jgi:hypothetical protein